MPIAARSAAGAGGGVAGADAVAAPIAALALAIGMAACGDDEPDLPPLRFETAHFRYHAYPEASLCPRYGDWLEQHYAALTAWLGPSAGPAAGEKIDYYLLRNRLQTGEVCGQPHGDTPGGCTRGRSVYTERAYHPHELVHAYAGCPSPLFFCEGIAVLLGGGNAGAVDRTLDVESLVATAAYSSVTEPAFSATYSVAGSFSRFLVDRYGRDAYLSFYVTVPRDAPPEEIRTVFMSMFGESLEAAVATWRAEPAQGEDEFVLHLAECASAALDDPVSTLDGLSCDGAGGIRPLRVVRTFHASAETGIVIRATTGRVLAADVYGCDHALRPQRELLSYTPSELGRPRELWTNVEAGDYWLSLSAEAAEGETSASDVSVSVERTPPLIADACATALARDVATDTSEIVFAGTLAAAADDSPVDGLADVAVRFRVGAPRTARTTSFTPSDAEERTLCASGCPGESAATCGAVSGTSLVPGTEYTLTLAGTATSAGYRFGLQLAE